MKLQKAEQESAESIPEVSAHNGMMGFHFMVIIFTEVLTLALGQRKTFKIFLLYSQYQITPRSQRKKGERGEREMERREGRGERVRKLRRERDLEGGKVAVYARCTQQRVELLKTKKIYQKVKTIINSVLITEQIHNPTGDESWSPYTM